MTSPRLSLAEVVARGRARSDTDPGWRTDYTREDVEPYWEAEEEVAAEVAAGRACGLHDRPLPCIECAS